MNIFDTVLLSDEERRVIFSAVERLSVMRDHYKKSGDANKYEELMSLKDADFEALKENAFASLLKIYAAAAHFVNVSRVASDIANAVNMMPDEIMEMAKMRSWEVAVRRWGWTGETKPEVYKDPLVPATLRETFLLLEVFQKYCPVRLVTSDGFVDTRIKGVFKYEILLADGRRMKKHDVILAFPKDRMSSVKNGIKVRKSIADLNLGPIPRLRDRPKLNVAAQRGDIIECVMRNGLVVVGENIWISKYNIVMRVGGKKDMGGKVVLLYRHGLHGFEVHETQTQSAPEKVSPDVFDAEEEA